MAFEKKEVLIPILESENQIHISVYLENRGDLGDLKRQIKESVSEAEEHLEGALSVESREALLRPIRALLQDASVLKQLRGNIGLFRTKNAFRVLSVPIDVKRSAHVASSFHVKPLLRWMQWDCEFLLVGLESDALHLYLGSQQALKKVDSLLYSNTMASLLEKEGGLSFAERRTLQEEAKKTFGAFSDWIAASVPRTGLKLYVAGAKNLTDTFAASQDYRRIMKSPIADHFTEDRVHEIVFKLRSMLKAQVKAALEQALLTFRLAEELNRAEANLREIAKAAARGKVSKLVIAENKEVFGKMDAKSGKISIHPFDIDHEDDDLLDDLAQRVLISGGEVYVAKQEEIPNGHAILAIIEDDEPVESLRVSTERYSPRSQSPAKSRSLV